MPRKVLFLFLMLLLIVPMHPVYAEDLVLEGKRIATDNLLVSENKVMLPIRPILEELDYRLAFNAQEGSITVTKGEEQIELYLGQPKLLFNNQERKLRTAPQLTAGKTMIDAQDICILLGLKGYWEAGRKSYYLESTPKLTEEGVMGQLLAADRQMLRAVYYNNQDFLTQNGVAPSPVIVSKQDLELLLKNHWSTQFVDNLWQTGSLDGRYVGFYSEGPIPLSYNKEMELQQITASGCKVRVLMPLWGDEEGTSFAEQFYTLVLNEEGNLVVTDVEYQN